METIQYYTFVKHLLQSFPKSGESRPPSLIQRSHGGFPIIIIYTIQNIFHCFTQVKITYNIDCKDKYFKAVNLGKYIIWISIQTCFSNVLIGKHIHTMPMRPLSELWTTLWEPQLYWIQSLTLKRCFWLIYYYCTKYVRTTHQTLTVIWLWHHSTDPSPHKYCSIFIRTLYSASVPQRVHSISISTKEPSHHQVTATGLQLALVLL